MEAKSKKKCFVKSFMPISINVRGKKVLLVGGGKVALHKIMSLKNFNCAITIIAREVCNEIKAMPYTYLEKDYDENDLEGYLLVYACTNDSALNQRIKADGEKKRILVNVVDNPELCDFVSPAIYKKDNISIAVSSNGEDVFMSIKIRNLIQKYLESDTTLLLV